MAKEQKRVKLNLVATHEKGVYTHKAKEKYRDEDLVNINIKDYLNDDSIRFRDYSDEFTMEIKIVDAMPAVEDEEAKDYVRNVSIAHDTVVVDVSEIEKPKSWGSRVIGALKKLIPTKRRVMQLYMALLFNANLKGYIQGDMFRGDEKFLCSPGINCYSCPGAIGACPLGTLQNSLKTRNYFLYIFGILFLYGIIFGRFICGWLCPFGLVQDLLHKIKTPKIKKNIVTRALTYLKYVLLVLAILFAVLGVGTIFCQYICPAGILEAAFGMLPADISLLKSLNAGFAWKFSVFISFVVISVFVYRAFCRFICPLGAFYSIFNKISFLGIKLEKPKCTNCGRCIAKCQMDIRHVGDRECIGCGECIDVCPTKAISFKGPKIILAPNEIEIPKNATEEEIAEIEAKQSEINAKTKKRNNIVKTIIGIVMAVIMVGALVYYNVVKNDALWDNNDPPIVDTDSDTTSNTDSNSDSDIESDESSSDSDVETDTETETVQKPPVGSAVGNSCPSASLPIFDENGFNGASIDPSKTGKVTIINFWYTTCTSCVAEMPHFNNIATEYSDKIVVIEVHSTSSSFKDAFTFVNDNYLNSEMIFVKDSAGKKQDAYYTALGGSNFGVYPMTVILDEDGVITFSKLGSVTEKELGDAVKDALK